MSYSQNLDQSGFLGAIYLVSYSFVEGSKLEYKHNGLHECNLFKNQDIKHLIQNNIVDVV